MPNNTLVQYRKGTNLVGEYASREADLSYSSARLASQVMQNVAALATFSEQLKVASPSGSKYYDVILNEYARASVERLIERWR